MAACCSINMRIFKTTELIFLLFFIVYSGNAAPGRNPHELGSQESTEASTIQSAEPEEHYDQRQNGTENYRIHVDGLVVVVAPVEALLLAGGIPDDLTGLGIQQPAIGEKPPKPEEPAKPIAETQSENIEDKPLKNKTHRGGLRLMSLLQPFLRKPHSHH